MGFTIVKQLVDDMGGTLILGNRPKGGVLLFFHFLRDQRIHTMLMRRPAAVAVKYFLSADMKHPVMIISE